MSNTPFILESRKLCTIRRPRIEYVTCFVNSLIDHFTDVRVERSETV